MFNKKIILLKKKTILTNFLKSNQTKQKNQIFKENFNTYKIKLNKKKKQSILY